MYIVYVYVTSSLIVYRAKKYINARGADIAAVQSYIARKIYVNMPKIPKRICALTLPHKARAFTEVWSL